MSTEPESVSWEVSPQSIRVNSGDTPQLIPLSLSGDVASAEYLSSNPEVAEIGPNGVIRCGMAVGNAMVMVWSGSSRQSLRHVAVEVRERSWFARHVDFLILEFANVPLNGEVFNAVDSLHLANVLIEFRRSESSAVDSQILTDMYGAFGHVVPPGRWYVKATLEGFIAWTGWIVADPSIYNALRIVLAPVFKGELARIVLQWGANPSDLDAHLTGPKVGGGRFHLFYEHKKEPNVALLDVDALNSYGPETITVLKMIPGVYRYAIHDYTNRTKSGSQVLSQSGATVRVITEQNGEQVFTVPDAPGTVWTVFEIDGATGVLTLVNSMSFQTFPIYVIE